MDQSLKTVVIGIISSFISGSLLIIIDRLILPNKKELIVGIFELSFICLILSFIFTLCFYSVSIIIDTKKTKLTPKTFGITAFVISFYFIYQIFPIYYYKEISNELINQVIKDPKKEKEYLLKLFNRNKNDMISAHSSHVLETTNWIRKIMEDKLILSILASIHPKTSTVPFTVNKYVMLSLEVMVKKNGIYLRSKFSELKIEIFPMLKFKFNTIIPELFISENEAIKIYTDKYSILSKDGKAHLCPQNNNFLLFVKNKKCKPLTSLAIMNFIANSKDRLWIVCDFDDEKYLFSPFNFRKPNNYLFNIFQDYLYKFRIDIAYIKFAKLNNQIFMNVITTAEFEGNDNWIILDDLDIIEPNHVNFVEWDEKFSLASFPLSDNEIIKIKEAKKITIRVKLKLMSKHLNISIPLTYFNSAFSKFEQL